MKKLLAVLIFFSLMTLVIAACSSGSGTGSTSGSSNSDSGGYMVHMSDQNFAQSSVTIRKGGTIMLMDDAATPHIIASGSWVNGSSQPIQEKGMPTVNNVQISGSGNSQVIGPFTTPGTFHLYCTVHPGMNLTVIVQ
ncbi:cupredoxin domain-containing protein [Dictyobacter formicarum]|uniref:Blue (type 1) copper domain-containing protein n=1 Tax=Dictyobacter formicarum TaxID=2778368 RepID=A0ABQ3VCU9_9CHLR|nr:plastocyanin/azurin family copper-binding protein [Dictyobacter formicarum]GHO83614.1 hypothetical protein KSZ_16200 [Dictyobacter formicarum]